MADAKNTNDTKKRYTYVPRNYWASTLVAVQGPDEGARTVLWTVDVAYSPWVERYVVRFGYSVNGTPRKGWKGTLDQYREELKPVMPINKNSSDPQVRKLVDTLNAASKVVHQLNVGAAQRAEQKRKADENRKARDAAQARAETEAKEKAKAEAKAAKKREQEAAQAHAIHATAHSAALANINTTLGNLGEMMHTLAKRVDGIEEMATAPKSTAPKADGDDVVLPVPEPSTDPTDAPGLPDHFFDL